MCYCNHGGRGCSSRVSGTCPPYDNAPSVSSRRHLLHRHNSCCPSKASEELTFVSGWACGMSCVICVIDEAEGEGSVPWFETPGVLFLVLSCLWTVGVTTKRTVWFYYSEYFGIAACIVCEQRLQHFLLRVLHLERTLHSIV